LPDATAVKGKAGARRKAFAERFEDEIQDFLKTMGFHHVRGGRTANLGGIQIDAAGGYGDTYVVIDCHTSHENRKRSVRTKIKTLRGVRRNLRNGLQNDSTLARYRDIRLIVCTKNIEIGPADRTFAKGLPRVYLWDERLVKYYRNLAKKIADYALYGLLGELGIKALGALPEESFRVPAFRTVIRGRTLFSFWVDPEVLLRIAFVARREIGREDYYQRLLKGDRLSDISEYISDERRKTLFPNSIIINFRKRPKFVRMRMAGSRSPSQFGWLSLPSEYRSAWVIDGQHRPLLCPRALEGRSRFL
jgi:hypothetical protein